MNPDQQTIDEFVGAAHGDFEGRTPHALAVKTGQTEIADLLK